jgi:hypothetical protein
MSLSELIKIGLLTITLVSSANQILLVLLLWFVLNVVLGKSLVKLKKQWSLYRSLWNTIPHYAAIGNLIFEVHRLGSVLQEDLISV